jgi:ribokinase
MRALVYGAINPDIVHVVDRLPAAGDDLRSRSWQLTWGGKATNVAVALAGWGVDTRLLGLVLGDDPLAHALVDAIDVASLDSSWLEMDGEESTRHCIVLLTPDGDRTIVCSGYESARWQAVPPEAWADVDVVVLDGFAGPAAARVAGEAGRRAIPVVWLDAPDPQAGPPVELIVWSRNEHTEAEASSVAANGPAVCLTAGPDPVVAWWSGRCLVVSPPEVESADTTGAGDVFAAACALRIAEGHQPVDVVTWAAAAGSASARSGRGGMPSLAEINDLAEGSSLIDDTSSP